MSEALLMARKAFTCHEVPVGAVVVFEGQIIAKAHNGTEAHQDATFHAELLAIRQAAKFLGNWRLNEAVLYTTLEPCAMCAGAAILSRLKKIVYGAKDLRQGADGSLFSLLREKHPIHMVEVTSGVLALECGQLMRQFFQERRNDRSSRGDDCSSKKEVDEHC